MGWPQAKTTAIGLAAYATWQMAAAGQREYPRGGRDHGDLGCRGGYAAGGECGLARLDVAGTRGPRVQWRAETSLPIVARCDRTAPGRPSSARSLTRGSVPL